MRTLVIDTATRALSVALFKGDTLVDHHHELVGRGHAERLVPAIAGLAEGGRAERIAVGCGPGSFTGTRVAIAAARALAFAWDAGLEGFDTLALIEADARRQGAEGEVAVVAEGGHGEWLCRLEGEPGAAMAPAIANLRVPHGAVCGDRGADLLALRGDATAPLPGEADARAWPWIGATDRWAEVAPRYARAPDAGLPG